jgi:hypothetical protein
MMHMSDAVDLVRRRENRALRADGDDTLVGSKHMSPYAQEGVPDRYAEHFAELRNANLRTARAWPIKEMLRDLCGTDPRRPRRSAGTQTGARGRRGAGSRPFARSPP